jgi:hypothetical protein
LPAGFAPALSYEAWRALLWDSTSVTNSAISGPAADDDQDGIVNFGEYALGLHPRRIQNNKRPQARIELINGTNYLTLEFTASASAVEANVTFQVSSNLVNWLAGPPHSDLLWSTNNIDGTTGYKFRDTTPVESTPFHFVRLRVSAR